MKKVSISSHVENALRASAIAIATTTWESKFLPLQSAMQLYLSSIGEEVSIEHPDGCTVTDKNGDKVGQTTRAQRFNRDRFISFFSEDETAASPYYDAFSIPGLLETLKREWIAQEAEGILLRMVDKTIAKIIADETVN